MWRLLALAVSAAVLAAPRPASAGDPYAYFDWDVSYVTAAPLGVKQQVIGINGKFPGPVVNITTNWNVVVNVLNDLDEPLLITCMQERDPAPEELLAGRRAGHQLPHPGRLELDLRVPGQGPDRQLLLLPLHRPAARRGGIRRHRRQQPRRHRRALRHPRRRHHHPHRRLVQQEPHGSEEDAGRREGPRHAGRRADKRQGPVPVQRQPCAGRNRARDHRCASRADVPHPGAQRGDVDEPQLPDPGAPNAAGGDGGILHDAAELHQPGHPRRPVLLLPPHRRPERQLRLLRRRQRSHGQRLPLAARHRRRPPPLLQLRRPRLRPAPGPAPGPVRQDPVHEPGAVRALEPQRRRGPAQPAGLLPLLLHQRHPGVPAPERGARGHRREAQGDDQRAVLLPAGHAAAARRRVRRGRRVHAGLPGAAGRRREAADVQVRDQRHLPRIHGAHLPEQRHQDAELPRGRVRRVRRRDGLRRVDGGQPRHVQQGGQRGAQHRAGVPRRLDRRAGVAGQRRVLERAVAEPRLVVPRAGGLCQGGQLRRRRQQDRDGRPPQRPLLRPAPQVPEGADSSSQDRGVGGGAATAVGRVEPARLVGDACRRSTHVGVVVDTFLWCI